jgi:DNA modification methylase
MSEKNNTQDGKSCVSAAVAAMVASMNHLYYGDNLTIMQGMNKHSVDLIYLDPPFNSKQNYNLMYKTMTGKPVPEQAEAFCDTWEMDAQKEEIARTMPVLMRSHGVDDYYVAFWDLWMQALRNTQPHLLAYLIYMVQRMLYMKSILRPAGSIYLHCDPTASHYIKVMMDGIFGHQNFRSEIIWKRTGSHGNSKGWGPSHDVILFYSASEKYTWNKTYQPYDAGYLEEKYRGKDGQGIFQDVSLTGPGITQGGDSGKPWKGFDPTAKGRHWAIPRALGASIKDFDKMSTAEKLDALDAAGQIYWPRTKTGEDSFPRVKQRPGEGVPVQDVLTDISALNSQAQERLGYPTQKPVTLLKRIISASTNPGDVVFDPFCGCGTTVYAAHELEREWIGCDIAILAVKLMKEVLAEKYRLVEGINFDVRGIPVSVEQAEILFKADPFQFQHWIVERVGGFPMQRKVADRGIDGRLYFEAANKGMKEVVISVKGGKIAPTDVRDLRGVLEREANAEIAGFLCLQQPTKAMRTEAASAGLYEYGGMKYPRIQLLTVQDIIEGHKELLTPTKVGTKISSGQFSLPLS